MINKVNAGSSSYKRRGASRTLDINWWILAEDRKIWHGIYLYMFVRMVLKTDKRKLYKDKDEE